MPKVYYGAQTELALSNFSLSYPSVHLELLHTIALIKRAAVQANVAGKRIPKGVGAAIERAAAEVVQGKHDDQFKLPGIQGGAGTSIHMNVNEVIAVRAEELLKRRGMDFSVHPNDHVNMSQSTNDVNPSALRIVVLQLLDRYISETEQLVQSMKEFVKQYGSVKKLARTHMQDAVPTTIREEWGAYTAILERNIARCKHIKKPLYELNLGGSAIGNGVNVPSGFKKKIYEALRVLTDLPVSPAPNLMSLTSSATDFCMVGNYLTASMADLSKMATDIRFLSSGPAGGVGELVVRELQAGSSIMPGKRNPVIPELINQIYFKLAGNALTIQMAAEQSHLELAVMFPVIADSLITSLKLGIDGVALFRRKCVAVLSVNAIRCQKNLESSFVYATLFSPVLGYDIVATLVKEGIQKGVPFTQLILERKLLTEEEIETVMKRSHINP